MFGLADAGIGSRRHNSIYIWGIISLWLPITHKVYNSNGCSIEQFFSSAGLCRRWTFILGGTLKER